MDLGTAWGWAVSHQGIIKIATISTDPLLPYSLAREENRRRVTIELEFRGSQSECDAALKHALKYLGRSCRLQCKVIKSQQVVDEIGS